MTPPRVLKKGMSGPDVREWQKLLHAVGHPTGMWDGKFGEKTDRATRSLQSECGISVDGLVGPATRAAAENLLPEEPAEVPCDPVSSLSAYQDLALEYLDLATNGDAGRKESDPLYKLITEQRDWGAGYSSCGDLAHWLLYRLGVRERWLNRSEHIGWQSGANIARLAWSCLESRPPMSDEIFSPGDILLIWNKIDGTDAHALVVRAHERSHVYSADYGQPGGARRKRLLGVGGLLGERRVQRVIPLAALLLACCKRGTLAPAQSVNAWLASIGPKGVKA